MTTGTEGNDHFVNDETSSDETIDALGGDDLIEIIGAGSERSVIVDGGAGFDTLEISGYFSDSSLTETGGSLRLRLNPEMPGPTDEFVTITYTGIERILLHGLWWGSLSLETGASEDHIEAYAANWDEWFDVHTGGGDDTVWIAGYTHFGTVYLGPGNDQMNVDAFGSRPSPTWGHFDGYGEAGDDILFGSMFSDQLSGGEGEDRLEGGKGRDILDGGAGIDIMAGGVGDDTYVVDVAGDQVTELGAADGDDLVMASINYTLGAYFERLTLTGSAPIHGTGNALDNVLTGNGGANVLDGGAGADDMFGGSGDDLYLADTSGDRALEASAAGGMDTVKSTATFALGVNVEKLVLVGAAAIDGNGNTLDNVLLGNNAANQLNGGAGADQMRGLGGNDTYVVDNVGDIVVEAAGSGTDLVSSGVDFVLSASIENLILTGSAVSGTGNATANTITGNNAANILSGGGSADTLLGGLGTDTLDGGLGNDRLHGGANSDNLTGGAGFDGFYFDAPLNAVNVDHILDFVAADDTVLLDRTIFTGLAADGAIGAAAFRLGTAALDADDRILYNPATGRIGYDADGIGGSAAILFATVTPGTALTSADFFGY